MFLFVCLCVYVGSIVCTHDAYKHTHASHLHVYMIAAIRKSVQLTTSELISLLAGAGREVLRGARQAEALGPARAGLDLQRCDDNAVR